ncbi:MAG: DUF1640 domain-containing protein [Bdellovibrio sp.]|nr:DUF1640 domain-containing protein [Bdellovibrio sp.]
MFDTLMYAKRLEAAGMTREQAEAQIHVIAEMVVDGVATKQDIALHKAEMAKEFVEVRAEMAKGFADVRAEMAREFVDVRTEMASEFAEVRADIVVLRSEMHKENTRNLKIMGAMMAASTTFTIGVLGLLLK